MTEKLEIKFGTIRRHRRDGENITSEGQMYQQPKKWISAESLFKCYDEMCEDDFLNLIYITKKKYDKEIEKQ
jgi:hypothetical protein